MRTDNETLDDVARYWRDQTMELRQSIVELTNEYLKKAHANTKVTKVHFMATYYGEFYGRLKDLLPQGWREKVNGELIDAEG